MRCPTASQYGTLRILAPGAAGLSWPRKKTEPLLSHGWVTADWVPPYWQWVRITPDGLRALALAVERYGLPELGPDPTVDRRVCVQCGGHTWRRERRAMSELAP